MDKYLIVIFKDGSFYRIPMDLIYRNVAAQLAEQGDILLTEAIKQVRNESRYTDAAIIKAASRLEWDSVSDDALKISNEQTTINKKYGWQDAEKHILNADQLHQYMINRPKKAI